MTSLETTARSYSPETVLREKSKFGFINEIAKISFKGLAAAEAEGLEGSQRESVSGRSSI